MKKSTNLVLVSFLDDQIQGETFVRSRHNGWPLHVTLFPWFGVKNFEDLDSRLRDISNNRKPFEIQVGPESMFGESLDIPVNIIQDQAILKQLHDQLNTIILPDGDLYSTRYIGDSYNAHITQHIGANNRSEGKIVNLDHLYLVKMLDDNLCQFLKKYSFGVSS